MAAIDDAVAFRIDLSKRFHYGRRAGAKSPQAFVRDCIDLTDGLDA